MSGLLAAESGDEGDRSAGVGPYHAALFHHSLDLLCIAGFDGYFKEVNPSWTRVLGWTREELLARPVEDFMHPDDRERTLEARARLWQGVPLQGLENRYRCKDGSYRWLSWRSSSVPGDKTVFAVARDITEQRQADQLQLISTKLESTRLLAAGLAHDFNNLLATVVLNLGMVRVLTTCDAEQDAHLKQAEDAAQEAAALIRHLMNLAEPDGRLFMPSDLRDLVEPALRAALKDSAIQSSVELAPDLWRVPVDPALLRQLIRHLALNAIDAMPEGGSVRLEAANVMLPAAEERTLPAGRYVRLRFRDNGPGIAPEILPNIFDAYFSTKPRGSQKGMGLGLTLCFAILQRHRGLIVVDSTPGEGTAVRCYLPVDAEPEMVPRPGTPRT